MGRFAVVTDGLLYFELPGSPLQLLITVKTIFSPLRLKALQDSLCDVINPHDANKRAQYYDTIAREGYLLHATIAGLLSKS